MKWKEYSRLYKTVSEYRWPALSFDYVGLFSGWYLISQLYEHLILLSTLRLIILSAMVLGSSFDGKLLVPQWIMIWLGDNLMVGFMKSSIHCVLAPPKERTTTWWLLFKKFHSLSPNTYRTIDPPIIVVTGAVLVLDLLFLSNGLRVSWGTSFDGAIVTVNFLCGSSSFLIVFKLCGDVTVLEALVSYVS